MKKIFLYIFLLVSVGQIVSTLTELQLLGMICKPAILISLGLYYWASQREQQEPLVLTVMMAIVFSCVGDVLLMFQFVSPDYFMFGLGAFLLAHVFYIFAYKQHQGVASGEELEGLRKIRFALPVVLSGSGLVTILYNHLGELKVPVVIYAGVITYMVLTALFRFGKTTTGSFAMVFGGAILFMISDSLIAINKFLEPIAMANFWVMLTYISAQFLIVRGLIRHQ